MTIGVTHTASADVAFAQPSAAAVASDVVLLAQVAGGDRLAMRNLYLRHERRVFRFVLRMLGDRGLAEDVLSEVFFEVWKKAEQFQGRSSVSTWLLGICRHKALTAANRRPTESIDSETAMNIVDPANTPEAELSQKDTGSVIRRCLAALSPEHAEMIDLVYYQEKSIKEIVEILGIPENTVKTRMFYARKRLAALVAAEGIDRAAA